MLAAGCAVALGRNRASDQPLPGPAAAAPSTGARPADTAVPGRHTADPDPAAHPGVVLFHVWMRINRLRAVRRWLPVLLAMPPMLRELSTHPGLGLLSFQVFRSGRTILVVQYWRDFDALNAWARASDHPHLPAWRAYNRAARASGVVGVFHEMYTVGSAGWETIYVNTPIMGLARRGQSAVHRIDRGTPDNALVQEGTPRP